MVTLVQQQAEPDLMTDQPASAFTPDDPPVDRTCRLWLRERGHVCRTESGAPLGPRGGSCAIWARVQVARRHASDSGQTPAANTDAVGRTVALLAETHGLLAETRALVMSGAPAGDDDERLGHAWDRTAVAFLRADQAAALAGWYNGAE